MQESSLIPTPILSIYALFLFLFGALAYPTIEILWRGHTHFTMAILGGFCFLLFTFWFYAPLPLWLRSLCAVLSVLLAEYVAGLFLNVVLELGIWDYSNLPYSLHGQICLRYSIYWFYLCALSFVLLPLLERLCFLPFLRRRTT